VEYIGREYSTEGSLATRGGEFLTIKSEKNKEKFWDSYSLSI